MKKIFDPLPRNWHLLFEEEELTARINGRQWRLHKNDGDDWPSDPHAIDNDGIKLNLNNGDMHSTKVKRSESYIRTMPLKELRAVRKSLRLSDLE